MTPLSSRSALPPEVVASLTDADAEMLLSLEEAWDLVGQGRPATPTPDAAQKAATWATLESVINTPEKRANRSPLRLVISNRYRWMAAAAVIVMLLGFGYLHWIKPVSIYVPNGITQQVVLPDGSQVELNSGSTLNYRRLFALNERHVHLEGEAFFSVITDDVPFVVETFNAKTSVLGTTFNVRARHDDGLPATSVYVASGRVLLADKTAYLDGITLEAGQTSSLAAGVLLPSTPDSVAMNRALAWRNGILAFSNQPFSSIFAEIGRRYDIEIVSDGAIGQILYSFWLHEPENAESVLATLTQGAGLRYRETANGFEVYVP